MPESLHAFSALGNTPHGATFQAIRPRCQEFGDRASGFYSDGASVLVHRMMPGVTGSVPDLHFKMSGSYLPQNLVLIAEKRLSQTA